MRVTIEQREESVGISGKGRIYFVDCTVQFSEEERAIIKARDLFNHVVLLSASEPLPTPVRYLGTRLLRIMGRVLIAGGMVAGLYSSLTNSAGGFAGLIFFAGIGLEIYGWLKGYAQDRIIEKPEQEIRIHDLLSKRRFSTYVSDPAHGKQVERDIRASLLGIKQMIVDSAELSTKQSFEI